MCENLQELNPDDVKGKFENISVAEKLGENSLWCMKYDLVLATDLNNQQALHASQKCREGQTKIPFVLIRQYGLFGSIRLDIDCHSVMEQKMYMVEQQDLRLNDPF